MLPIEAQQKLVTDHYVLARSLAHRYRNLGVEDADLIQEACRGLTEAARSFSPNDHPGALFFEHARPYAIKRIALAIRESAPVKLPDKLAKAVSQCRRARAHLFAAGNPNPSIEQIALATGLQEIDIALALAVPRTRAPRSDAAAELPAPELDQHLERATEELWSAMEILSEQDREILIMRYGLEPDEDARDLYELSRETYLSVSELKRRLDSIRRTLRIELHKRGWHPPAAASNVQAHATAS